MITLMRRVLTLDTETFADFAASPDVFKRGLIVVLVVSLMMGLATSAIQLFRELTAPPPREQMREAMEGMEEGFRAMRQFTPMDPEVRGMIQRYARAGMKIGFGIAALPTRLPKRLGSVFESLGTFVSAPFGRLLRWMLYSLLVLLAAKLLGGKATVQQMLGTTALYALPHLLDTPATLLGLIPCVGKLAGSLLGLVALVWGIVVYVKATAVANELTTGKAAFSVVLPILVLTVPLLLLAILVSIIALIA